MADPMTTLDYDKVEMVIKQAQRDGVDTIERLNKHGLLLTNRRLMQLRTEALEQVAEMLSTVPAHTLLNAAGQPGNLAEDYRKVVVEHLFDLVSQARTKWFS